MDGENRAYRCSICGELIAVDDLARHMEEERAKPDWPGVMQWKREDKEEEDETVE